MLHQNIKEHSTASHQKLEATVVRQLKAIRSNLEYAEVLKHFYSYFSTVEQAIAPFITVEVLPDYAERRNSTHIKADIIALGGDINQLPEAEAPKVNNALEALSALYVLEGSIMGGPYIVQMLNKYGITEGTSFFSGYGEDTGKMWGAFIATLNKYGEDESTHTRAVEVANETFSKFGDTFTAVASAK